MDTETKKLLVPLSTLATRLKKARRVRHVTQQKLADMIGIKQQAIQRIEASKVRSSTYIVPIALALEVSPIWLAGGTELEPVLLDKNLKTNGFQSIFPSLPLFSWSEIAAGIEPIFRKGDVRPQIPAFVNVTDQAFAIQLDLPDDSMLSANCKVCFEHNATVFVDPGKAPKNDSFILVKTPELILRKYINSNGNGAYLAALNNKYESILFNKNKHQIIGVLVAKYVSLI
jgi:SOS-response transcriptional repressor LexA